MWKQQGQLPMYCRWSIINNKLNFLPPSFQHPSLLFFFFLETTATKTDQQYLSIPRKLPPRCWNAESGYHTFSCLIILIAREKSCRRQLRPHFCLQTFICVQLLGYLNCIQTLSTRECGRGCLQLSNSISKLNEAGLEFGRTKLYIYDKLLLWFMLTSQLFPIPVLLCYSWLLLNLWLIFFLGLTLLNPFSMLFWKYIRQFCVFITLLLLGMFAVSLTQHLEYFFCNLGKKYKVKIRIYVHKQLFIYYGLRNNYHVISSE